MTADQNKEILYIAYNHANMPTQVSMRKSEIEFVYDALGNKWYKFSKDGARVEVKGTAYNFSMQFGFKEYNHKEIDRLAWDKLNFEPKTGAAKHSALTHIKH